MYKHILVPTDGSRRSQRAVERAVALAQTTGARITGLFVAPAATPVVYKRFIPMGYVSPDEHAEVIQRAAAHHLAAVSKAATACGRAAPRQRDAQGAAGVQDTGARRPLGEARAPPPASGSANVSAKGQCRLPGSDA
jgi:nucleotide-binding universal stress UspA family protein